jgi:hypothetical protein
MVGTYESTELAAGINISSATPDPWVPGGPWDAQAAVVRSMTDGRFEVAQSRKNAFTYLAGTKKEKTTIATADALNINFEKTQREAAQPFTYHFIIRPTAATKTAK